MSEYAGYAKLRPGRIHLFCPGCKRKMSNMPRAEMAPPTAAICHVSCEECSDGCKDGSMTYMDSRGRDLCSFCGLHSCEIVGGERECDDRLVDAEVERRCAEMDRDGS